MIPDTIEKIYRDQYVLFIDTTPTATNPTWKPVGVGVTDLSISFNPQVDTEKWILERNARSDHSGNQKQTTVTQKAYKNDPVFEFVERGRDQLNYKTHILEVDTWTESNSTYPAKMSDGLVVVTSYMGENGEIEYDLHFEGDAVKGGVTIAGGVPTFIPNASI